MRVPKPGLSAVVAYWYKNGMSESTTMKYTGMWLRLDEFGSKSLRSARNLMQNTLDFNVINPVDSQHDTCTCKAIWLTCGVRWVYLFLSL